MSSATNLVAGDGNFLPDVFVHDRTTGITERVSLDASGAEGNGMATEPRISGDGRYVAFSGDYAAPSILAGVFGPQVFVKDRFGGVLWDGAGSVAAGLVRLASASTSNVAGNGGGNHRPQISANGRFVLFVSDATNLVAGDTNGRIDVFERDLSTGLTRRVSLAHDGAEAQLADALFPAISGNARYAVFASSSSNLVSGDGNGRQDVFIVQLR